MRAKIHTMRAWIRRREEKHKNWTSDELWSRIRKNWPTLDETTQEHIFQESVSQQ